MHLKSFFALYLTVPVLGLLGCTPLSERIAQRPLNPTAAMEISRQEALSLGRYEGRLSLRVDLPTFNVLRRYGGLIQACADRYRLDWRLILAVMKTESAFSSSAVSEKGAYGLMQIMPVTGAELERTLDLLDIRDPTNNIRGGVFYLRQLYDLFSTSPPGDRLRFALAAYNAGVGRVYDAQELAVYFHADPSRWISVRTALGLLSSEQCELHEIVWTEGRPKSGCFDNSGETLNYVDRVMDTYAQYKVMLE
jgi:membrane-bound lytic murein transglycosylase F